MRDRKAEWTDLNRYFVEIIVKFQVSGKQNV